MDLDQFLEEAIPLIAEDFKEIRLRLGMTYTSAAKRAQLGVFRYRALENGSVPKTTHNVGQMISVARRLGLDSVRMSYVDEIDQHMRVDFTRNETLTIFIDTLDSDCSQLKEHGHFVSPHLLLALVDQAGIGSILDSRKRIDKMMVELWITAILTTCLTDDRDYYVRPVNADAPDTEIAMVDHGTNSIGMKRVEITQHGRYSESVFDVIGKKLSKRYQDGTVLVVLVEESQELQLAELYEFVQTNNAHSQQIFIIGGSGEAGKFKILPWDEVTSPTPGEKAWMEITVDTKFADKGRCRFDGVVFKPPYTSKFRPQIPVFVKAVNLRR